MADFPAPAEGIVLTHFLVSDDVDRSRAFYTEVLGGEALMDGEPTIVTLANSWIIISTGGGPTDDKPSITLESCLPSVSRALRHCPRMFTLDPSWAISKVPLGGAPVTRDFSSVRPVVTLVRRGRCRRR